MSEPFQSALAAALRASLAELVAPRGARTIERVTVVAAHPDDETIGLGATLGYLPGLRVVHVTDGAPRRREWWGAPGLATREDYAATRRAELLAALEIGGARGARLTTLDVVDQECWHDLVPLARRMASLLEEDASDLVITHPYEGGHPDHDAAAFAVHAACRLLHARGRRAPAIIEFSSYHARADGGLVTGTFLHATSASAAPEITRTLSEAERRRRHRMLDAFTTQRATLEPFRGDAEPMRLAPAYDFSVPPHEGTLHYERFAWACTGEAWRARAQEACHELEPMSRARCCAF